MDPLYIVNKALREIGEKPATSMTDTNHAPARAITQYAYSRVEVLRMIAWPSVTHRALMKNMNNQACPWSASHEYLLYDRVTSDSDKTYQCTTAGISAGSGGPTGAGDGITDGTVIWKYVEASTALNNWVHQPLTAYAVHDLVTADNTKVYKCVIAGTTAAATPPSGTDEEQTDGSVTWDYYGTPPHNRTVYAYQYVKPVDCLRILKVPKLGETKESDQGEQYVFEQLWIYSNQDDSFLKYVVDETDPDRWDPLLRQAIAQHIAQAICLLITGQKTLSVLLYQKWLETKGTATDIAIHEAKESTPEIVRWEDL